MSTYFSATGVPAALVVLAALIATPLTPCAAAENEYRLRQAVAPVELQAPREPYQMQAAEYRLAEVPVATPAPALPLPEKPYAREISLAAEEAGVEPGLVHALIEVESAYRPNAVSPKGAVGLMQLLPATAQQYGISNLTHVPENLKAGTRHLRNLLDAFGNRVDLALAAYNAGEGAVRRHNNAIPPYRETRDYVPAVLKRYRKAEKPMPAPKNPAIREYMSGTRLDPNALRQLP